MTNLFKKWHLFHTWGKWITEGTYTVKYPWTPEGYYAYSFVKQYRACTVCGLREDKEVRNIE